MLNGSIYQKLVIILNGHVPNNISWKYLKKYFYSYRKNETNHQVNRGLKKKKT